MVSAVSTGAVIPLLLQSRAVMSTRYDDNVLLPKLTHLQPTATGCMEGLTGGDLLIGEEGGGLGEFPAGIRLQFPLFYCTWPFSRAAGLGTAGGGNSEGMEVFGCCPLGAEQQWVRDSQHACTTHFRLLNHVL